MAEARLRWTEDDEVPRLAAAALPLLIQDPKLTIVEAVRRVQDTVLPPERRRNLPNIGLVPIKLRNMLEQRRAAATGNAETVPIDTHQVTVKALDDANELTSVQAETIKRLEATISDLRAENTTLRAGVKAEGDVIKNWIADIIAQATVKTRDKVSGSAVGGVHVADLARQVVASTANVSTKHNPEGESTGAKKFKIAIVGGKNDQHIKIHNALNGRAGVELRFYDPREEFRGAIGEKLGAWKNPLYGRVILWTNYGGHAGRFSLDHHNIPYTNFMGEHEALSKRIADIIKEAGY